MTLDSFDLFTVTVTPQRVCGSIVYLDFGPITTIIFRFCPYQLKSFSLMRQHVLAFDPLLSERENIYVTAPERFVESSTWVLIIMA